MSLNRSPIRCVFQISFSLSAVGCDKEPHFRGLFLFPLLLLCLVTYHRPSLISRETNQRAIQARARAGNSESSGAHFCLGWFASVCPYVCSLPAFYFTVGHALAHTPPNQGRVGAMGCHAFGSFPASRRSWWAILRQCTRLCIIVDTSHQTYHKNVSLDAFIISLKFFLSFRATVGFVGFCVLASPEDKFGGS